MSHTITVTRIINDPSPDVDSDDAIYMIEGSHDRNCEAYQPCLKGWHRHPKNENDEIEEWSTKRVPEWHSWLDGEWMVPIKDRCGLDFSFEGDNPEFQMTVVGVYDVEIEWDGDNWLASLILRPAVPTDTEADQ